MDRLVESLNCLGNILERILTVLVGIALAGFTVTVVVEVFFRFFLGFSLFWTHELATYLFIYLVFFGGSVALKRGELISVDFFRELLPVKWQKVVKLMVFFCMMAFASLASVYATVLIEKSMITQTVSPAMLIPKVIVYLPIFLGFVFLAFFALIGFVNTMRPSKP